MTTDDFDEQDRRRREGEFFMGNATTWKEGTTTRIALNTGAASPAHTTARPGGLCQRKPRSPTAGIKGLPRCGVNLGSLLRR